MPDTPVDPTVAPGMNGATWQEAVEELHTAEEELRAQNEALIASSTAVETERQRYRELFNFAPDCYLVTNPGGVSGVGNGVLTIATRDDYAANLCGLIASFVASGDIASPGISTSLRTSCDNASRLLMAHNQAARGILGSLLNRLNAFVESGKVTAHARDVLASEIGTLLSSLH